jgi:hypothetical protein
MEQDVSTCLEASYIKERFVTSEVVTPVCFLEEGKHPVFSLFSWPESAKKGNKIPEVHEVPFKDSLALLMNSSGGP